MTLHIGAFILVVGILQSVRADPPGGEKALPAGGHEQSAEIKAFRQTAIVVAFASNGVTLTGWLYNPAGDGPFPAVIWNHGSEKDPIAHPELGKFYTDHGYVLFLPVRHGHGRSPGEYIVDLQKKAGEEMKEKAAVLKKQVSLHDDYLPDVVAALEWLRKQPFIAGERIAMSGCSYGGIQTLLAAEKGLGVRAFIPFAPGAMSWGNSEVQKREIEAVRRAQAPLFLLQARNDYSIGPSETLGPIIRSKGGLNRATIYPAFGTSAQEGHGGFACWQDGIKLWGDDVLKFLDDAGMKNVKATAPSH